jgi:kexin
VSVVLGATLAVLSGCGGEGGGGTTAGTSVDSKTVSAGPSCALSYTLTQSRELSGPDPLFEKQWYLENAAQSGGLAGEDLRIRPAWERTRGAGVRVAVVDDAVEGVHPDLLPNWVAGASFSYRTGNRGSPWPLPCTAAVDGHGEPIDGHGTAVAGIVLARDDNAIGLAGVAPRASLVGFDALASGQDADIADALLRDNHANAIYQNSWGSPDDGGLHVAPPAFVAAVRSGITHGRGGLGSLFLFPGGNGGCYALDKQTGNCQIDNANFDGFVNQLGVIAVCAVDHAGRQPWYGEPGANLLVCGLSSGDSKNIWTTTLDGAWRDDFSGTSASTPMVSGVVALMLSANPALSWRDVRLILAKTARRNDPSHPDWVEAADGLAFNHRYGFGVVDAAAAVQAATTWSSVGGSAALRRCDLPARTVSRPIPDGVEGSAPLPITDTVDASSCGITRIEFVEVRFSATHLYSGDLRIRLTSPAGRTSRLAEPRICRGTGFDPCGAYAGWTFGSVRHLGEAAAGPWSLEVADPVPNDTGSLTSWSLTLYGR